MTVTSAEIDALARQGLAAVAVPATCPDGERHYSTMARLGDHAVIIVRCHPNYYVRVVTSEEVAWVTADPTRIETRSASLTPAGLVRFSTSTIGPETLAVRIRNELLELHPDSPSADESVRNTPTESAPGPAPSAHDPNRILDQLNTLMLVAPAGIKENSNGLVFLESAPGFGAVIRRADDNLHYATVSLDENLESHGTELVNAPFPADWSDEAAAVTLIGLATGAALPLFELYDGEMVLGMSGYKEWMKASVRLTRYFRILRRYVLAEGLGESTDATRLAVVAVQGIFETRPDLREWFDGSLD